MPSPVIASGSQETKGSLGTVVAITVAKSRSPAIVARVFARAERERLLDHISREDIALLVDHAAIEHLLNVVLVRLIGSELRDHDRLRAIGLQERKGLRIVVSFRREDVDIAMFVEFFIVLPVGERAEHRSITHVVSIQEGIAVGEIRRVLHIDEDSSRT